MSTEAAEDVEQGAGKGVDATMATTEPVRRPGALPSVAVSSVQCRGCDGDCDSCNQVMTERDEAIEMCDKLAEKIARLEGLDIGEHTSANDPWQNALDGVNQEPE